MTSSADIIFTRFMTPRGEKLLQLDKIVIPGLQAKPLWIRLLLAPFIVPPAIGTLALVTFYWFLQSKFGGGHGAWEYLTLTPKSSPSVQKKASTTALMVSMMRYVGNLTGFCEDSLARFFLHSPRIAVNPHPGVPSHQTL